MCKCSKRLCVYISNQSVKRLRQSFSTQFLTFNGFSFVAGKYLQKLTIIIRLNGCLFQIAGVENLKYLDMTGWYCNAEMSDFSYFTSKAILWLLSEYTKDLRFRK
jgi:hypothetical protein